MFHIQKYIICCVIMQPKSLPKVISPKISMCCVIGHKASIKHFIMQPKCLLKVIFPKISICCCHWAQGLYQAFHHVAEMPPGGYLP
ncbi:hypothetical protein DsansV1_C12g0115111 [Dioscorea sansibarensis]